MSQTDTFQSALNLLARREHSVHELKNKLRLRKFPDVDIDQALRDLQDRNLQSDERYTECYIRSRAGQGYGPLRIKDELSEKGVSAELISIHIDENDLDWNEKAAAVKEKKFGIDAPAEYKDKAKQMRFLQYRGFTQKQISYAVSFVDI